MINYRTTVGGALQLYSGPNFQQPGLLEVVLALLDSPKSPESEEQTNEAL